MVFFILGIYLKYGLSFVLYAVKWPIPVKVLIR